MGSVIICLGLLFLIVGVSGVEGQKTQRILMIGIGTVLLVGGIILGNMYGYGNVKKAEPTEETKKPVEQEEVDWGTQQNRFATAPEDYKYEEDTGDGVEGGSDEQEGTPGGKSEATNTSEDDTNKAEESVDSEYTTEVDKKSAGAVTGSKGTNSTTNTGTTPKPRNQVKSLEQEIQEVEYREWLVTKVKDFSEVLTKFNELNVNRKGDEDWMVGMVVVGYQMETKTAEVLKYKNVPASYKGVHAEYRKAMSIYQQVGIAVPDAVDEWLDNDNGKPLSRLVENMRRAEKHIQNTAEASKQVQNQ